MSDNVENVTHELLESIQAGLAQLRAETREAFAQLKMLIGKERRNAAGTLVMMRATAGDFDARVEDIEARVAALEARV